MRVDFETRVRLREQRLLKAIERAASGSLRSVGYAISQIAKAKIKRGPTAGGGRGRRRKTKPSSPGQPPHTRRGQLRRAIRYAMTSDQAAVVVGPVYSMVEDVGKAHEFGGKYKGERYPRRPFMGPSLEEALPKIGPQFKGSVR